MTRDVPIDSARGFVVLGWRSSEGGLSLRIRGQSEETRLVCRCGRRHWIVREVSSDRSATLVVTCHNCGTRATFSREPMSLSTA